MITNEYKKYKEQVLALYGEYVKACELAEETVSESIKVQAEKIRDEVFNLMILGEAKSGKSTFINAYLGKEVVPMDVRQCTSAIIKIKKGDTFELIATTAAGGKSVTKGYDNIREFLKKHAAISDEYRSIPLTTINNELLIKYKDAPIPQKSLEAFLEMEKKDNIYNLEINEYNNIIRKYIREQKPNWGKIITEMEITYQLPDTMQGITIIDSPGVGAGGNVGRIAEEYIKNANAIIFVKSLTGQALESSSFMNFLRHNCTDRKKESLFLVLTGKSNLQGTEFDSLKEQAVEMYKKDIREEKILFVDSKMQLFLNKCHELGTVEKIDDYFDRLDEEKNDFSPASNAWMRARGDLNKFEEKMNEASNFNSVERVLDKFARVANYLQLIQFLDNIRSEYRHYAGIYTEALRVAEENIDDPAALEDRILQKKKELDEVYIKISKDIHEIYKNYTDNLNGEGIIMNRAEERRQKYEAELENFRGLPENQISDQTFSELKKVSLNAIDDSKDFREEMAKAIIEECNKKLIQYTNDPQKIPAEAYVPNFTAADFDAINESAAKETSGYTEVEQGWTFKSVEKVPYHHWKQHVKKVVDNIHDRLNTEIIPKMTDNVVDYIGNCRNVYMEKLNERKGSLEKEYQKLLDDKDNNEKQIANVEALKVKISAIGSELQKLDELKGELKNYVG